MVVVEELDLSVDGRTAIVVRRTIQGNRYLGHLFAIDLGAGRAIPRPRQLTRGIDPRHASPGSVPTATRWPSSGRDPTDDDAVAAIAPARHPAAGPGPASREIGDHGAVGELAWSPDGRRLAFTAEVDPPRFITGTTRPIVAGAARDRRATTPARPPDHPHRLALGRGGAPRPLVAPVRPRHARRPAAPGDERRLGRRGHRLAPGRPARSRSRADRGPEPDLHPRTTIWAVDVDAERQGRRAARGPGARRLGEPPGRVAGRPLDRGASASSSRSRSTTSARRSSSDRPTARGRRGLSPRTSTARSATGSTRTSPAGWCTAATVRSGWTTDRIVATVSDRGRSHPHVFTIDPATATSRRWPAARPRASS